MIGSSAGIGRDVAGRVAAGKTGRERAHWMK